MKIINLIALDGNVFSVCANPAYFLQLTMGKGLDSNGAQTQYIERKGKNAGHCAEDTFNLFRIKMLLLWGAAVAQWIRSRLPSCLPGFDSQAHILCFFQFKFEFKL